jgi:hypothetical protein
VLIENTQRREGGSRHIMADGTEYHFKPDAEGREVAEVTNKAHIDRFLTLEPQVFFPRDGKAAPKSERRPRPSSPSQPRRPPMPPSPM